MAAGRSPRSSLRVPVSRAALVLFALLVLAIGAGAIFLATWDIPAPLVRVEQILPADRFPK